MRYFPSKDFLLQTTIERRDEADQAGIAGAGQARGSAYLESLVDLVRHNQNQQGIVRPFTTVSAEAVDAEHPAWSRGHHQTSAERIRRALAEAADKNALREDGPTESIARGLIAAMDGLQLQWLCYPSYTDMAADFRAQLEPARYRWGQ